MHYRNGREAKNGDKVFLQPAYPKDGNGRSLTPPVIGILYDAVAGNDHCNGKVARVTPNDACPDLKDCLHLDDVLAALPATVADSSVEVSGTLAQESVSAPPNEAQ